MHCIKRESSGQDLVQLAERGELYCVLDACDEPLVPALAVRVAESSERLREMCLYDEALSAISPYLLPASPLVLDWIHAHVSEKPWGILIRSRQPLGQLAKHFRSVAVAEDSRSIERYLRFFDPRVFPVLVQSMDEAQLDTLFEHVDQYWVPDARSAAYTCYQRSPSHGQEDPTQR